MLRLGKRGLGLGGGGGGGGRGGVEREWRARCAAHPRLFRWPSGKASVSRAADVGSIPAFAEYHFSGQVIPVT